MSDTAVGAVALAIVFALIASAFAGFHAARVEQAHQRGCEEAGGRIVIYGKERVCMPAPIKRDQPQVMT